MRTHVKTHHHNAYLFHHADQASTTARSNDVPFAMPRLRYLICGVLCAGAINGFNPAAAQTITQDYARYASMLNQERASTARREQQNMYDESARANRYASNGGSAAGGGSSGGGGADSGVVGMLSGTMSNMMDRHNQRAAARDAEDRKAVDAYNERNRVLKETTYKIKEIPLIELNLEKAAKGDIKAMGAAGYQYATGKGVTQNRERGISMVQDAANRGDITAMSILSYWYRTKNEANAQLDLAKSHEWAVKAATAGDIDSMTVTGIDLLNGTGVAANPAEAQRWLTLAAGKNDGIANLTLGNLYSGKFMAMPSETGKTDLKKAEAYYRKAIASGVKDGVDKLAELYEGGDGTEPDWPRAFAERKPLADAGDPVSETYIGLYYERGYGVPKDMKLAAEWFTKAAKHGSARGNYEIGRLYFDGEGVPEDNAIAVKYTRQAAVQGFPNALHMMGLITFNGKHGVAKDNIEAERLIRLAAEKGNVRAAHDMGVIYEQGSGVEKDRAESRMWFKACADGGDERCVKKMKSAG